MAPAPTLSVTRVINPCALVQIDGATVLTDPFLRPLRRLPMNEPIGMRVDELPALAAVLGGHGAFDHWQLGPLDGVIDPSTPVLVPHARMARHAVRHGFSDVRLLRDGATVPLTESVSVTAVGGDRVMGRPTNHYVVVSDGGATVYVGTEACSLEPMRRTSGSLPVDVAVLPVDGLRFAGRQLVMDATTAVEAARILGARVLVPFHHSQRPVWPVIRCPSGIDDLLARPAGDVEVRHAPSGVPIDLSDLVRRQNPAR